MATRSPLPDELAGTFTVARATVLSVGRGRLRNPGLEAPTRGVRRVRSGELDLPEHAGAFALALPGDAVFSHLTAARLHRLPTPTTWPGPAEPLHVMRSRDRPRVERTGCVHHRGLESRQVVLLRGLRATSAPDTWCHLVGTWPEPHGLAAADVLLRRGLVTPSALQAAALGRRGRRGSGRLVSLAAMARPGSASPGESLARWWFWRWGLPEPELNSPVLDEGGGWLATADFVWKQRRVVGEYDGDVHRTDRATWQRDRERRAAVEDARWTYVEMSAGSFAAPGPREALRRRLTRLLLL